MKNPDSVNRQFLAVLIAIAAVAAAGGPGEFQMLDAAVEAWDI